MGSLGIRISRNSLDRSLPETPLLGFVELLNLQQAALHLSRSRTSSLLKGWYHSFLSINSFWVAWRGGGGKWLCERAS